MADPVSDIVARTTAAGLDGLSQADLMGRYCEDILQAGVPLWRASIGADARCTR